MRIITTIILLISTSINLKGSTNFELLYKKVINHYSNNELDSSLILIDSILLIVNPTTESYYDVKFRAAKISMLLKKEDQSFTDREVSYLIDRKNQINNDSTLAYLTGTLGYYYFKIRSDEKAIPYLDQAIIYFEKSKDFESTIRYLTIKANLEDRRNNVKKAIQILEEAEKKIDTYFKVEDAKSNTLKFRVYNGIAVALRYSKEYEKSNLYLEKAMNLEGISSNYYSIALSNYANNFYYLKDYDASIKSCYKILAQRKLSRKNEILTYNTLILDFVELEERDSSRLYLGKIKNLITGETDRYYYTYLLLKADVELLEDSYEKSITSYNKILNLYLDNKPESLNTIHSIKECIIEAKINLIGDTSLYNDFLSFQKSTDTLNQIKNENEINSAVVKYQTEKKEQEIVILNQKNILETEKTNRTRIFAGISSLFSILFLGLILRLFKQHKTIKLLRHQENHSVENSYARIIGVIEQLRMSSKKNDTKTALDKANSLIRTSAIIHRTIRGVEGKSKNANFVLQKGFKDLCDKLERFASFEKRIKINVQCDDDISLNTKAIQSLFLLLEELITNASKHAFKDQANPTIDITLSKIDNKWIQLSYLDNGIGLPHDYEIETSESNGLEIVKSLVRKLHGKMKRNIVDGLSIEFDFQYEKISA